MRSCLPFLGLDDFGTALKPVRSDIADLQAQSFRHDFMNFPSGHATARPRNVLDRRITICSQRDDLFFTGRLSTCNRLLPRQRGFIFIFYLTRFHLH